VTENFLDVRKVHVIHIYYGKEFTESSYSLLSYSALNGIGIFNICPSCPLPCLFSEIYFD
jgi:hypothetical protein